jgi:hypothetical protein
MGTNCAPLLADLFFYSYEAGFIQELLKKNENKLARSFNFTFRYIDDELFGRIRVVFYKIRSVSSWHKIFVSTLAILFYETQLNQLP